MAILSSCNSLKVNVYENEKPAFDFFKFFEGNVTADGFFQDRGGFIVKRMHVEMKGRMEGDLLIVDEDFTYSDGTKDQRTWKFKKSSDGRVIDASAPDVKEVNTVEVAGNAFHMNYVLNLKVGSSTYEVRMDDWMYRMNDTLIINKTKMSKFGVSLGEITLTIQKK